MNRAYCPASQSQAVRALFCFLGALLLSTASALSGSTLADGLQLYYPFSQAGDGALDASGNGRHGVLTGTSWASEGHPAGSRHLGSGSYINAGNAVNFASWTQYSISVWFRHDTSAGDATGYGDKLFCKTAFYSDQYIRMLPSRSEYSYGHGAINFTVSTSSGGFSLECRDDFRDNAWHHLSIVRNGVHAEMWIDGVMRKSCEAAITVTDNTQPIYLGYSPSPDSSQCRYWPGDIDEFRIYNRALRSSEVRDLAGLSAPDVLVDVASPHGLPTPSVGTNSFSHGACVTARVDHIVVEGVGTRYLCTGWLGSGSVPATGDTNSVCFTITNNSTLAWQWRAEHKLSLTTAGGGTVSGAGWYAADTEVDISAAPDASHVFVNWSDGNTEASRRVTVPVGGMTLSAVFGDPPPGSLRFSSPSYVVDEAAANTVARLTVQRVGGTNGPASVTCALSGQSATAGEDFACVSNTLSWSHGDASDKTLFVVIVDDADYETAETFSVTLTGASGAKIGTPATTTVTIQDNDEPSDWETGSASLGGGWRRLAWFGDYAPVGADGWIWHNRHGFLFVAPASTPTSIWLYTQDMGWLWTGRSTYPFLFRQSDGAWIWYNGSVAPRWFMNMQTGEWEFWP